ncbi:MAG: nitroreductase [Dehalococcoidia bacterium]|nr:nitroreductase [Dehalococcoidia bacterium]
MDIDSFSDLVKRRRSIRRFKPDPVPDEQVTKILEAARFAMSGGHAQPWEFVVVRDREKIGRIAGAYSEHHMVRSQIMEQIKVEEMRHPLLGHATGRPGLAEAPVIIVVCGDPRTLLASTVIARFLCSDPDSTFYMNLGNVTQLIHLAAAALGLGAQWVSVSRIVERDLKDILGIPEVFRILSFVPIGFPAYQPTPLRRRELSDIVHYDHYDQSRYRTDEGIREWVVALRGHQNPGHRGRNQQG